jgi:hypothetical protein
VHASSHPAFCGQIFEVDPYWRPFPRCHRTLVLFGQIAAERFDHYVGRLFRRERIRPAAQFNSGNHRAIADSLRAQFGECFPVVDPETNVGPAFSSQRAGQPPAHTNIPVVIHYTAEDFPFRLVKGGWHALHLDKSVNKQGKVCE